MLNMLVETAKDDDFPARILNYFNKLVPDGYPNKVTLDEDDINELTNLTQVMEDKLHNQAKLTDPDKIFGPEVNEKTINESKEKKRLTMMDEQQQPPFNFNGQNQHPARNSLDYYVNKYAVPDIGIMEM